MQAPQPAGRQAGSGPPRIRAILFDKDGTLFDFFSTWIPVYRGMAAGVAAGDAAVADRLLAIAGMDHATGKVEPHSILAAGTWDQLAALWTEHLGRRDGADLARELRDYARAHSTAAAQPVTDLPALFHRLRDRGLKLGVATMDSEAGAYSDLSAFGVTALLDFIAGYDSGHGIKPGPGMVRAFCRTVDIPPTEIAVIGDTTHDLHMARAAEAGLAVGVLSGASPASALEQAADRILGSIAELESLLEELRSRSSDENQALPVAGEARGV